MAFLEIENLTFRYPGAEKPALTHLSFAVETGELCLVLSPSGGGKTTLFSLIDPAASPRGDLSGQIRVAGQAPCKTPETVSLLRQDAELGLVTDKVWSEVAFAPENRGLPQEEIRLRAAEAASLFGLENLFYRDVFTLSGGEKVRVLLASYLADRPSLILLDEPVGQLDPIAEMELTEILLRLKTELGVTILVSEQRGDCFFAVADRVLYLEEGRLLFNGTPGEAARFLLESGRGAYAPETARLAARFYETGNAPLTVRGAMRFLENRPFQVSAPQKKKTPGEAILSLREAAFRFEKDAPAVLNALSLDLCRGEILCLLGKGGAGKSTLLRILAGDLSPQKGRRILKKGIKLAFLPQDVRCIFERETVEEELNRVDPRRAGEALRLFDLVELTKRHPLDLSGGERQRASLAKLWLTEPDVLLLDEPTRGLDRPARRNLAALLQKWNEAGAAILVVTHDAAFAAQTADRCAFLFNGEITGQGDRDGFFSRLGTFTTATARATGGRAFLPEEVEPL